MLLHEDVDMHLTRATDIALRVLMLSGARDRPMTIDELADALNLMRNHVAKVVQRLHNLELVITRRGRGGGVALTERASRTSVGVIVRELEGASELVRCDEPPCPLRDGCRLRHALHLAQEAFFASLDTVFLADLLAEPTGPVLLSLSSAWTD